MKKGHPPWSDRLHDPWFKPALRFQLVFVDACDPLIYVCTLGFKALPLMTDEHGLFEE